MIQTSKLAFAYVMGYAVTLLDIQDYFKVLGLAITSGYGAWKWYTEYKKEKKSKKHDTSI